MLELVLKNPFLRVSGGGMCIFTRTLENHEHSTKSVVAADKLLQHHTKPETWCRLIIEDGF